MLTADPNPVHRHGELPGFYRNLAGFATLSGILRTGIPYCNE